MNNTVDNLTIYGTPSSGAIGQLLRSEFSHDNAMGHREELRVNDSFFVETSLQKNARPWCRHNIGDKNLLKIHFRLAGKQTISPNSGSPILTRQNYVSLLYHPDQQDKVENFFAGEDRAVTLFFDPTAIMDEFKISLSSFDSSFRELFAANQGNFFFHDLPISFQLSQAIDAIFNCSISGELRSHFLQAKTIELLCLILNQLQTDFTSTSTKASAHELSQIRQVGEILDESFVSPPSLRTLAHAIGTNETKLCLLFKNTFGMTIGEYCLQKRMQRADHLLKNTDLSLTKIAFDTGYNHASNFITAFKRFYGYTPRTLRK